MRRPSDIEECTLKKIRGYGMVPMVTMVHFTYPGWLADRGGMLSDEAVPAFERFAELITQRWAGDGTMWVTLNEPLVFFKHEMTIGQVAPQDFGRFLDQIVAAHRLGYAAAHRADPVEPGRAALDHASDGDRHSPRRRRAFGPDDQRQPAGDL